MGPLTRSALRQSSHQRIPVDGKAALATVNDAVLDCADRLRADAELTAAATRAADELATNLLRHAVPGGWILLRPLAPAGIEILAVDRGPGILDLAAAVGGRAPSPRGVGHGLATVRSASSYFDAHTDPDRGTVILAVVQGEVDGSSGPRRPVRRWGGVSIGIDEACGDGWAVAEEPAGVTVAVVDGLGHGIHASIAADAAIAALASDPADLDGYLGHANTAMRDTRGGAVAVCRADAAGDLRCLSVGNISARLLRGDGQTSIVASNGTVGVRASPPATRIRRHPWPPAATLVMWSDGLPSHLDLTARGELLRHDPAVAAAALHRDHTRERDDATVVVLRNAATP